MELRYLDTKDATKALEALQLKPPQASHTYLAAFEGDHLLGVAQIYADPAYDNIHIESLDIAKDALHQGVATTMLDNIYARAQRDNKTVTNNSFTGEGQQYLMHVTKRLCAKYNVDTQSIGRA